MSDPVRDALDRATAGYQQSMGAEVDDAGALHARARLLEATGAHGEALGIWLELLERPVPKLRPALLHALIRCALRDGELDRVSAALEARAQHLPVVRVWRGYLLRQAARPADAVPVLTAALDTPIEDDERFQAVRELVLALAELGQFDQAAHRCAVEAQRLPQHADWLLTSRDGLLSHRSSA